LAELVPGSFHEAKLGLNYFNWRGLVRGGKGGGVRREAGGIKTKKRYKKATTTALCPN